MRGFTRATFAPLFARAREGGVLRDDVTEEAMIEWLQGVLLMLAGRDDLDEGAERELMRNFVLRGSGDWRAIGARKPTKPGT